MEDLATFERQFRVYYGPHEIASKSAPMQLGILLHTAGPGAQDVHETFTYTGDEQSKDIEAVLMKFRNYCHPPKSIVFECYQIWDRNQIESEPIDHWVIDLRSKAAKCEFGMFETNMIRDKVMFGVREFSMTHRLIREVDLALNRNTEQPIRRSHSYHIVFQHLVSKGNYLLIFQNTFL